MESYTLLFKIRRKIMRYCPKFKMQVEEKICCYHCIFWVIFHENQCDYDKWHPGLKKGKDEQHTC